MVSARCCRGAVPAACTAVCSHAPADACMSMSGACAPLYVKALLAIVSCPGAYNTGEIEELLGVKLTELYEGNSSALRVLGANGALRCGRRWAGCAGLRCGRL